MLGFPLPLFPGPVRGVDFHPNQPLFVTGGDDYKIKVGPQSVQLVITLPIIEFLAILHAVTPLCRQPVCGEH